jgi:chromatin segregation and condensation protein Rec8/ScpA/Scc1 (kleisin family)
MVHRLKDHGRLEFQELFDEEAPRGLIIATFLGLLEMIKNLVVAAEQEGRFGPIWLRLVDENVDETIADLTEMYGPGSAAESGREGEEGRGEEAGAEGDAPEAEEGS